MTVQPPPEDFDNFVTWFDAQFGSLVAITWPAMNSFFNEHTKCSSYEDFNKLLNYAPGDWLSVLGPRLYEMYRTFIYDLQLIFYWVDHMESQGVPEPWEYSTLLEMRHKVKESVKPLPELAELFEQQWREKQANKKPPQPKLPSYHSRSNVNESLGTAPYMPNPTAHQTSGSYHTTSPNQVDEQGDPFTTQNFNTSTWSRYHARVGRIHQRSRSPGHNAQTNSQHYQSTGLGDSQRSQRSNRSHYSMSNMQTQIG